MTFYRTFGTVMRETFGCNVWKICIDAGLTCPNLHSGGCVFCNIRGFSPSPGSPPLNIREQIDAGICNIQRRYSGRAEKFIAYFQPSTNTNAPLDTLEKIYSEALEHPEVVGLAVGTRPDCLDENVLDLLQRISRKHWVQLEIGLQSIHQKSLDFLNRGHTYETFLDAFNRSRQHSLRICVHYILGIPGESREHVLATANETARLHPDGVKLHNLYVVKDTPLAELWKSGKVQIPTLEEYAGFVVDFIERIPPDIVIDRISGEASNEFLLAPDWTADKHAARNAVAQEFMRRRTEKQTTRRRAKNFSRVLCVPTQAASR